MALRARHLLLPLLGAAALLGRPAYAYHLEDSLRDGTAAGNPVGGSFTADGWVATSRTDRLWFAIPRLASGSIEFTLAGVSPANLTNGDNEMFAMYEAGYGMSEPIPYLPQFRNNHYKVMLRIYGVDDPDRAGQQKLVWAMCPSGDPGYDECGCAGFEEEPFGGDPNWDGSPQRLRIEWGDGVTRLLRNGGEVVRIDWSGTGLTFGPDTLHFSLGTSRGDAVDYAGLPVGAVFSDLVVDGVEGDLAVCPGGTADEGGAPDVGEPDVGPPDGGADPPPDDAGTPPDTGSAGDADATSDDALLPGDVAPSDRGGAEGAADLRSEPGSPPEAGVEGALQAEADSRDIHFEGGCGCLAAPRSASGTVLLVLAVLLGTRRTRRAGKLGPAAARVDRPAGERER